MCAQTLRHTCELHIHFHDMREWRRAFSRLASTTQPALRQVRSFFQSQFSAECDLVLPISISSIFSFPKCHPIAAYLFFFVFPSLLLSPFCFSSATCLRRQFLSKMWPIQSAFLLCIVCRNFLFYLIISNISSFVTWSSQLIFSILLQHHISKTSSHFSLTFGKCPS